MSVCRESNPRPIFCQVKGLAHHTTQTLEVIGQRSRSLSIPLEVIPNKLSSNLTVPPCSTPLLLCHDCQVYVDAEFVTTWTSSGTTDDFESIDLSGTPGKVIQVTGVLGQSEWLSIVEVCVYVALSDHGGVLLVEKLGAGSFTC